MVIRCKASHRFLMNLTIENHPELNIISRPIVIEIPCPKCKLIEVYEIRRDPLTNNLGYKHVNSYKYVK